MPQTFAATINGCLPQTVTLTENHHVLAGIALAHICKYFYIYLLVLKASSNTKHFLYNHTSATVTPHRHLASRRPFHQEAVHLQDTSYDVNNMWKTG